MNVRSCITSLALIGSAVFLAACYRGAAIGTSASIAQPSSAIVAKTGHPEILEDGEVLTLPSQGLIAFLYNESKFKRTDYYAPLRRPPPHLSRSARAGRGLSIGYRKASWIVDGDDVGGFRFYFDEKGTGDLSGAVPHAMSRDGAIWTVLIPARGDTGEGVATELIFQVVLDGRSVVIKYMNLRRGKVMLDGATYAFAVSGISGYYGFPSLRVFFDLNQDGVIDFRRSGNEWVYYRQRVVVLGGLVYKFDIDRSGTTFSFRRSNSSAPVGSRLVIGSKAPKFGIQTTSGFNVSSAQLEGRRVLLDFWSMSCAPCVAAFPKIAALLDDKANVVVIGITPDEHDERLQAFLAARAVEWSIGSVDLAGAIYSAFKVDRFPTYVLLNEQGKLLCVGCTLEEVRRLLD